MTSSELPAFEIERESSSRHREWRVQLTGDATATTLHGEDFTPHLATVLISAKDDHAPYTKLRVNLIGNGPKGLLAADFNNDAPNTQYSILNAPAWVRELFAEVTSCGYLVNTYVGPEWAADLYAKTTTPDARFPAPDES
jgi:hypothetical protein